MDEPPEFRIRTAIDNFVERLIVDCSGAEDRRQHLHGETDNAHERHLRQRASGLIRRLLSGHRGVLGPTNIGQPGERYVKETLIWPLLDALEHEYRIESYLGKTEKRADFRTVNTAECVLGEAKAPNDFRKATSDLREDLRATGVKARAGILTDGFSWQLVYYPDDPVGEPEIISEMDIRMLVASRFRMKGIRNLSQQARDVSADASVRGDYLYETDSTIIATEFTEQFSASAVDSSLEQLS